jgi:hypothetical protein
MAIMSYSSLSDIPLFSDLLIAYRGDVFFDGYPSAGIELNGI